MALKLQIELGLVCFMKEIQSKSREQKKQEKCVADSGNFMSTFIFLVVTMATGSGVDGWSVENIVR